MMCLYDKPCSLWHYKHKIYDKKRKLQEIIDEHLVEEEGGASAAAAELLERNACSTISCKFSATSCCESATSEGRFQ